MIAKFNVLLNPKASIYRELEKKPEWWKQRLSIEGVHVEIRNKDIVEVYYEWPYGKTPIQKGRHYCHMPSQIPWGNSSPRDYTKI